MDVAATGQNAPQAAIVNGMIPQKVLAAQTAQNTQGVIDLGATRKDHTLQVNAAAGVTGGVVKIITSLDGVNYFTSTASVTTNAAGAFQAVLTGVPARFVGALIATAISGGGAPAVDAWIGSC